MKKSLLLLLIMTFVSSSLFSQITISELYEGPNEIINTEIISDKTLSPGTFYVAPGDVHIRKGTLTIQSNATLAILKNSKIIVHPGANLVIKGTIFPVFSIHKPTTVLDLGSPFWQGIQVKCKDRGKGKVTVDGGTICNADIAISNFTWSKEGYFSDSLCSYENRMNRGGRIIVKRGAFYACTTSLAWDIAGFSKDKYSDIQATDISSASFIDDKIFYISKVNVIGEGSKYLGKIVDRKNTVNPFSDREVYHIEVNATGAEGTMVNDLDRFCARECLFQGEKSGILSLDYDFDIHNSIFDGCIKGFVAYKTSRSLQLGNLTIQGNMFSAKFRGVNVEGFERVDISKNYFINSMETNNGHYERVNYPCGLFIAGLGEGYDHFVKEKYSEPDDRGDSKRIQENYFGENIQSSKLFSLGIILINPSDNVDMNYLLTGNFFPNNEAKPGMSICDIDLAGFKMPVKNGDDPTSEKKTAEISDDSVNSGVKDIKTLTITPNPVQSQFRIETPIQESIVRVYSINGVEQYTKIVDSKTTEINTLDWVNGIYSITIENAGQVISTGKVCVSK